MAAQEITRYDDHLIVAVPDSDGSGVGASAAVVSFATRSINGETLSLTHDGTLAHVENTTIAVSISGAEPQSIVEVNDVRLRVDSTGRAITSIDNTQHVSVEFHIGTSRHVVTVETDKYANSLMSVSQPIVMVVVLFVIAMSAFFIPGSTRKSRKKYEHHVDA